MKKLFSLFFVLCALATFGRATDVNVGASTIPNFNASSLAGDVPVSPVSVVFGSPTVTCSNCFRQQWIGMGGFRVTINGVAYTVAYVSSPSSLTLSTNYAAGDSPVASILWYKYVELRVYPDSAFQPSGKTYVVQPGAPGSGAWYRRVAASIVNELGINNLYIPQLVLDSTTDSLTNQSARYYAAFYRPGGSLIQGYDCFDSFSLQPTGSTTWPDICLFNQRQVIVQDSSTYTATQIDSFRTGCTIGQSLYYAVTGLKPACLNFGAGLSLIGNTLSATAGTSYQTILNNGTPLTQRTILNFLAPSFVASDNAGASRTDVDLDSDLNALASTVTNGLWARTGTGTGAARTLQSPAAGFSITNPGGVAGNPAFTLTNDLGALEGLSGTGGAYRIGADTWANRTLTGTANRIAITNPDGIAGPPTFDIGANVATNGNNLSFFSSTTSAQLAGVMSDETGSGALVFGTGPTLTSPRIGTSILDTSGNEYFVLSPTASAVNEITLANAATGNPPTLSPSGSDSNVDLLVTPKGTGRMLVGAPGASPVAGAVGAASASGTNTAGVNYEIASGKGTGNAAQGLATFRYPLTGASGTTLQSLSTADFPPWTSMFIRNNGDVVVSNTTAETSLMGASQAGSTKTIEAGLARVGRIFFIRMWGAVTTTGTPTLQLRLKLNGVTVADTGAITMANNTNSIGGSFYIECLVTVRAVGATGVLHIVPFRANYSISNGGAMNQFTSTPAAPTVDLTVAQTFDITAQWSAASASNLVNVAQCLIDMSR